LNILGLAHFEFIKIIKGVRHLSEKGFQNGAMIRPGIFVRPLLRRWP